MIRDGLGVKRRLFNSRKSAEVHESDSAASNSTRKEREHDEKTRGDSTELDAVQDATAQGVAQDATTQSVAQSVVQDATTQGVAQGDVAQDDAIQGAVQGGATTQQETTAQVARRLALKLVCYGAIVVVVLSFVIGIYQVHDNDMYPSLRDGDLVVTYKLGAYYTGDAVVYEAQGKTHYGRVVAVADDEVSILEDGYFAINGSLPYERIFYPTEPKEGGVEYPYRVKEGSVFVMGDMRQQAHDSREFGAIPIQDLKGKVVLVLFRGREI